MENPKKTLQFKQLWGVPDLSWHNLQDYLLIFLGSLVQALAMRLFLVPALLVSGGISGLAQVINYFTDWSIGIMVLIGNLPLFLLGWRYLGGRRFATRTLWAIVIFSVLTDLLAWVIPPAGVTDDLVLNSLYGGLVFGVGLGLVYRGKGTSGGSDILGLILYRRKGISMTQAYLLTDAITVLAGGLAWNWELALYGMVVIYVSGIAAELASEGLGTLRTAMIVTNMPEEISARVMEVLERGVTILPGTGAYTHQSRPVLYCVITRSEVNQLKELVREVDAKAFMVIGQAHEALGEGFKPLKPEERMEK
ncbi:MAG: YitT family protein [Chloroflexi bacterium]|nr:YitT family protein [Chloroflexota bacterium]